MILLNNLNDPKMIGPAVAVAIMTLFYSFIFKGFSMHRASKIEQYSAEIIALGENVKANAKKITLLKNVVKSHIKRFADFLYNLYFINN